MSELNFYDLTYDGPVVQAILDTAQKLRTDGYIFMGAGTPETVPGTPTERVWYLCGPGTYSNFGTSVTVPEGSVMVAQYASGWTTTVIEVASGGGGGGDTEIVTKTLASEDYVSGYYLSATGVYTANANYKASDLIDIGGLVSLTTNGVVTGGSYKGAVYYKEDGTFLSFAALSGDVSLTAADIPTSARYVAFTFSASATPTTTVTREVSKTSNVVSVAHDDADFISGMGIPSTGKYTEYSTIKATAPLDIRNAVRIKWRTLKNIGSAYKGYTFFDASLNVLASGNAVCAVFAGSAIPTGACYIAFNDKTSDSGWSLVVEYDKEKGYETLNKKTYATTPNYLIDNNGKPSINVAKSALIAVPLVGAKIFLCPNSKQGNAFVRYAFHDITGGVISTTNDFCVVVPTGTTFVSVTAAAATTQLTLNYYPSGDVDTTIGEMAELLRKLVVNKYEGKTASFLGDSITAGYGTGKTYFSFFSDLTGMTCSGFGQNGASIGDRNDATVQIFEEVSNLTGTESLVGIFAGTNDFGHNVAIGDYYSVAASTGEKSAPATTATTAGGLHKLINDVRTACPNARIVVMTPTPRVVRGGTSNYNSRQKNGAGYYLQDYADCIKDICAFYCIPVLDLLSISQLDANVAAIDSAYFYDGLHLNTYGHEIVGNLLSRFVNENVVIL
jgi:lysophospholipase L1-like esterase